MAKQVATNSMAAKFGGKLNQAVESHKDDEVKLPGGGELPDGIENGIAQLVDCRFSQYKEGDNKGEWFFLAAGVVVEPKSHQGIPTEGMRTQIMEPIMDTPTRSRKTVEDHVAWVMNEMRKLGLDTTGLTGDALELAAEALKEAQPYFLFRTWKGEATAEYPNPRTNQIWVKAIENYEAKVSDDVVDSSAKSQYAPADEAKPAAAKSAPKTTTAAAAKTKPVAATKAPEPEEPSLAQLGEDADGGDVEAATKLAELAQPLGIDTDAYGTWAEVAELLEAQGGDGGASDDGSAAAGAGDVQPPKVGEVYFYKPEKAAKASEMEVTAVFDGKQACNVRDLTNKAMHRSVPWTELRDSAE